MKRTNPWQTTLAAEAYDRIYRHTADVDVYLGLARAIGGPILEVGCGSGRCLIPIIRGGFDTVGLDNSDAMLERLRRKLSREPDEVRHRAMPLAEDGRDFLVPLRFGMAFTAANSFTHFLSSEDQERFARNVFHHLRPGGFLAIDIFNPSFPRLLSPSRTRFEQDGFHVEHRDIAVDFARQTVTVSTVIGRGGRDETIEEWQLRYSFRYEIHHLLEKCGFEIIHVWGDYEKTEFGQATDRIFVVARKPPDADMTVVRLMHAAEPVASGDK